VRQILRPDRIHPQRGSDATRARAAAADHSVGEPIAARRAGGAIGLPLHMCRVCLSQDLANFRVLVEIEDLAGDVLKDRNFAQPSVIATAAEAHSAIRELIAALRIRKQCGGVTLEFCDKRFIAVAEPRAAGFVLAAVIACAPTPASATSGCWDRKPLE
jgi:hypothetical protein